MPRNLYTRTQADGTVIWYGRIEVGGIEHRRSLRTTVLREARRRLEAWRRELEGARFAGPARMTWPAAVLRYTAEVMPQQVKPSTGERYLCSLGQVRPWLDPLHVDQIDRRAIADLVSGRRQQGATNATINRDLTAVSCVLGACQEWGACQDNAARAFNRRRLLRERRDPIRPPSDEELAAVLAVCPGHFRELVRFLALTGCREEEAAGLEWPQVRLQAAEVTFIETKTSRPRTIELCPEATSMLSALPRWIGSPVVFWHGAGERYRNVSSRFAAIRCRAGVRFRPHDLRHRYAILELRAGRDIYDLAKHLGHASVRTTELYLGYVPGRTAPAQQREEMG